MSQTSDGECEVRSPYICSCVKVRVIFALSASLCLHFVRGKLWPTTVTQKTKMENCIQHFSILLLITIPNMISGSVLPQKSATEKLCPRRMGGWSAPCKKECTSDSDCDKNKICCTLSTCATFCAEPLIVDENGLVTTTPTNIVHPSDSSPFIADKIQTPDVQETVTGELNSRKTVESGSFFNLPIGSNNKPTNTENRQTMQPDNCHDECLRHLECGTRHICQKVGCRHVCSPIDTEILAAIGQPIVQQSRSLQNYMLTTSFNTANQNRNTYQLRQTPSGPCRRQCYSDSDCRIGMCMSINCHTVCRRPFNNIPIQNNL